MSCLAKLKTEANDGHGQHTHIHLVPFVFSPSRKTLFPGCAFDFIVRNDHLQSKVSNPLTLCFLE